MTGHLGRAGSGPAGPAGAVPYRFTDGPAPCGCQVCERCPCEGVHVTGACACCRAGDHNGGCGPLPAWPGVGPVPAPQPA